MELLEGKQKLSINQLQKDQSLGIDRAFRHQGSVALRQMQQT